MCALGVKAQGAEMGELQRFDQFGLAWIVAGWKIAGEAARQVEQDRQIGEDGGVACGGGHHRASVANASGAGLLGQDSVEHVGDEALLGARQA